MKKAFLILSFVIPTLFCLGQTGSIKGIVFDRRENKGLPFANVYIENLKIGAATDQNGHFTIDSIPFGQYSLKTSYLGYGDTTISVAINGKTDVILILPPPCKYDKYTNDKTCPICHRKDNTIPIVYGLIIETTNKKTKDKRPEYHSGGCNISYCMPHWYCKSDHFEF